MRRRRVRIQRYFEEDLKRHKLSEKAATVQSNESASPSWLKPSQLHLLEIQQSMGNQSAMRVMRGIVQRAPQDEDDKDKPAEDAALTEQVDTGDATAAISNKDDARSLVAEAIIAYKAKKYGTALMAFRESLRFGLNPHTLINLGICELRLDLFPEAQDDLSQALTDPSLEATDRTRATAALDSALKLESTGSIGFLQLPSNVNTDESPLAKEPRAIRNQIRSFFSSAESAAKSEDYDAALNAFRIAQKRLPHPITQINIAKCLVMLQRYADAETILEMALHNRQLYGPARHAADAERETARRFRELRFDDLGPPPPIE